MGQFLNIDIYTSALNRNLDFLPNANERQKKPPFEVELFDRFAHQRYVTLNIQNDLGPNNHRSFLAVTSGIDFKYITSFKKSKNNIIHSFPWVSFILQSPQMRSITLKPLKHHMNRRIINEPAGKQVSWVYARLGTYSTQCQPWTYASFPREKPLDINY